MEAPICVTDAQTFIDHIHEIKSWIYDSQLRLIVPSSLPERVDQLYQKSIEPKPTSKETTKLKAPGKPTKKEHPTFDANPKIAKAYLTSIQAGKDYETGAFGRPIYEEEEKHGAIHFAQAKEQYSPWKDVEEYEEKVDLPADRAESWAEKLRRKQNVINENNERKLAKGPVKPKLVAKTGADNSPWKVQKNAPTIPATEVPGTLRPVMSCALWRMHESIHRNDENQVFVLTDQSSVKGVAQKLNIAVRSTKELAALLESRQSPIDLEKVGALELRLGMRQVKERRPVPEKSAREPQNKLSNGHVQEEIEKAEDTATKVKQPARLSGEREESRNASPDQKVPLDGSNEPKQTSESFVTADGMQDVGGAFDRAGPSNAASNTNEAQVNGLRTPITQEQTSLPAPAQGTVETDARGSEAAVNALLDKVKSEIAQVQEDATAARNVSAPANVTLRSFAEALTGNQSKKSPPAVQPSTKAAPVERSVAPARITTPNVDSTVQPPPAAAATALDDPGDSDEEVVVFQPKRLSAQTKSAQQSSRPSTPNVQTQRVPAAESPRSAPSKPQSTPKAKPHSHRPVNPPNSKQSNTQLKADDAPAPVVIDPDAFGRGFAVNTNKDSRGSIRGTRARHSPQASLFNAGPNANRPSSSHRQPRTSPHRPSPKTSPPQAPRLPMQAEVATVSHPKPTFSNSPDQPVTPTGPSQQKHVPARHSAHIQKSPGAAQQRHTSATRKLPPMVNGASAGAPPQPMPIGTGRPPQSSAMDARAQTLNANAPVFQPASIPAPVTRSPLQQQQTPPPIPAKQPPIGSGRPSSKQAQQKPVTSSQQTSDKEAVMPPQDLDLLTDLKISAPQYKQPPDSDILRDIPGNLSEFADTSKTMPRRINSPFSQPHAASNGGSLPRNFSAPNFRPHPQGGRGGRQVKQSLFNPELDHTRAFQPEPSESRRSNMPEVQYVVKSGSTREQARGKGKLWIG